MDTSTFVKGCSEHKRNDQYLFCAHPAYRSHKQWHDWALFDWSVDDDDTDEPVCIPGQIIMFLEVTANMVGIQMAGQMEIIRQGIYTLIGSLEEPLPLPGKGT